MRLTKAFHAANDSFHAAPRELFMRPARAFSIVEIVAKARTRISNCRSRNSSILQLNLHIQNEIDFCGLRQKFMLIIWPFELFELCRPAVQEVVFRFTCAECSVVEVACLAQNIRHCSAIASSDV